MRKHSIAALVLVVAIPGLARAQGEAHEEPAHVVNYRSSSWEPVFPTFALGSNTDGSNSVSFTAPFVVDTLPDHPVPAVHVTSWTIGPTVTLTDNSKAPVVSLGGPSGSPNFGLTTVAWGILLGYTLEAPIIPEEELGAIVALAPLRVQAAEACRARCGGTPAPEDAEFCKMAAAPGFDVNGADPGSLCPSGKTRYLAEVKKAQGGAIDAAVHKVMRLRTQRLRYPEIDLSVWAGAGASQFSYYEQNTAGVGTGTVTFNSSPTNKWQPNAAVAAQVTSVPWLSDGPLGLTFELPVAVREAYQASKKAATPCTTVGTSSSSTTLQTCGSAAPLGPPSLGAVLNAKGYVGLIDRVSSYWRVALGVGYSRNFVDSSDTVSIELPLYVNVTGLAGGKDSSSSGSGEGGAPAPKSPVQVAYNGIVRITPTLQHSTSGWSAVLNFDLLGQRNLFTRADSLVK